MGEEAVVIAAAPAQPLARMIAGDAGQDGKVHRVGVHPGRAGGRLRDTVSAGGELAQLRDLTEFHDARPRTKRHAQTLSGRQGILQDGPGINLTFRSYEAEYRPGLLIFRHGQQMGANGAAAGFFVFF